MKSIKRAIKKLLNSSGINRILHHLRFRMVASKPVLYRGAQFFCSTATEYEQQLLRGDYNEDLVIGIMAEKLAARPGVFLDIGANMGVFSLAIASQTDLKVIAFEPEPLNYLKLQRNMAANPSLRVKAENLACSDSDGSTLHFIVPFNSNRGCPFVGHLAQPRLFWWELEVPSVTVDSYLEKNGVSTVVGFKIDVEGFEEFVLKGMERLLANAPNLKGLIELHPHIRPVDCAAVFQKLKTFGFSIFEITRTGDILKYSEPRQEPHALWVEKASPQ
jgi:FkbM family methyltransferase